MTKNNNNQMFIWGGVALVVVAIIVTVVVVVMKNRNKGDDYSPMGTEGPMSPFASEYPSTNTGGNGSPTPIGGSSTYYTSPSPGGSPGGSPGSSPMSNDDDITYPM